MKYLIPNNICAKDRGREISKTKSVEKKIRESRKKDEKEHSLKLKKKKIQRERERI